MTTGHSLSVPRLFNQGMLARRFLSVCPVSSSYRRAMESNQYRPADAVRISTPLAGRRWLAFFQMRVARNSANPVALGGPSLHPHTYSVATKSKSGLLLRLLSFLDDFIEI